MPKVESTKAKGGIKMKIGASIKLKSTWKKNKTVYNIKKKTKILKKKL